MKIDPKYAFLHAFLKIFLSWPFQNLSIWPKTHPFFQFCMFCTPKRCMRIHCLVLKNNPYYVNFWTSQITPLTFECPPLGPVFSNLTLVTLWCLADFLVILCFDISWLGPVGSIYLFQIVSFFSPSGVKWWCLFLSHPCPGFHGD